MSRTTKTIFMGDTFRRSKQPEDEGNKRKISCQKCETEFYFNSTGHGEELLVPLPLLATAWTPWSGTGWWSWWVHRLQPCETLWPKRWWPAPTLSTDRETTDSRSGTTHGSVATATSNCPVSPNNRVNHTMVSLPQLSEMERNLKLFFTSHSSSDCFNHQMTVKNSWNLRNVPAGCTERSLHAHNMTG